MSTYDPITFTAGGTDPLTLHGDACGTGSPILLFLHYWGGSAHTWRPVIDRLRDGHRCIAYDSRGWGRSGADDPHYTISDLAGDALAVLEALAPQDVVLVGHSMGGKVAQAVAAARPAGLTGLVLVAPAPARPARALGETARRALLGAYDDRDSVSAAVRTQLAHRALDDTVREQIARDSLAGTRAATRAWPLSAIAEDVSAGVAQIDVPTLVVAGDHDGVEPAQLLGEHVAGVIPGARLSVIPDCGHLIPLEQPRRLAELIAGFTSDGRGPVRGTAAGSGAVSP